MEGSWWSWYGKAIVGTVSGTSISFGSEVTFNPGSTDYVSAVYDSANSKVVITYDDSGNGNVGTAIVGTVSGTSISFASPAVFLSAQNNSNVAIYDSINDKIVSSYLDPQTPFMDHISCLQSSHHLNNLTSENFIGISDGILSLMVKLLLFNLLVLLMMLSPD